MTWSVEVNEKLNIVHIVYKGSISETETAEATKKALELATHDGQLFLADLTEAEVLHSTIDLYNQHKLWETLGSNRKNDLAVVIKDDDAIWEQLKFFEAVSKNRGWKVQLFTDRQKAIDWLTT